MPVGRGGGWLWVEYPTLGSASRLNFRKLAVFQLPSCNISGVRSFMGTSVVCARGIITGRGRALAYTGRPNLTTDTES